MFKLPKLLFDEPESNAGGGPSSTDDVLDIAEFLKDDDPDETIDIKKPVKKEEPKKEEKDEEVDEEDDDKEKEDDDDELEALIEDTEGPKEEQLELVTPVRRREILKKYPNVFKDFPYLEKAYYREQQFTELLPTINDAKLAVEKSTALDRFEQDLMGGNVGTVLKSIKESNPNSFNRIVDNILPTLQAIDENAYLHVLGNMTKHTIISMLSEAKRTKNETLESAAVILNQYVFGNSEFVAPTRLAKDEKPNEKETQLNTREQQISQRQFESAYSDLNSRVNNSVKSAIEGNIDPKNSMTDYIKKNAVREANELLSSLMDKDTRFKSITDKLWEDASKKDYNRESIDRLRSAYLSRAKTLLPAVIKKARIDALRGTGKRVRDTETEVEDTKSRDKSRPPSKSDKSDKSVVPKGMSTLEFLNKD